MGCGGIAKGWIYRKENGQEINVNPTLILYRILPASENDNDCNTAIKETTWIEGTTKS